MSQSFITTNVALPPSSGMYFLKLFPLSIIFDSMYLPILTPPVTLTKSILGNVINWSTTFFGENHEQDLCD